MGAFRYNFKGLIMMKIRREGLWIWSLSSAVMMDTDEGALFPSALSLISVQTSFHTPTCCRLNFPSKIT